MAKLVPSILSADLLEDEIELVDRNVELHGYRHALETLRTWNASHADLGKRGVFPRCPVGVLQRTGGAR